MKKNIVKQASNKFVSLYRYALNVTNASMKYTILDVIRENFMIVSIVFIVVQEYFQVCQTLLLLTSICRYIRSHIQFLDVCVYNCHILQNQYQTQDIFL